MISYCLLFRADEAPIWGTDLKRTWNGLGTEEKSTCKVHVRVCLFLVHYILNLLGRDGKNGKRFSIYYTF